MPIMMTPRPPTQWKTGNVGVVKFVSGPSPVTADTAVRVALGQTTGMEEQVPSLNGERSWGMHRRILEPRQELA